MIDKDRILSFIHDNLKILILSVSALLVVLLVLLIVSAASAGRAEKLRLAEEAERAAAAIPPEAFFLPPEPLQIPGVQLSRESPEFWSEEEASRWYVPPSRTDLEVLRQIGEETVENLLEMVP